MQVEITREQAKEIDIADRNSRRKGDLSHSLSIYTKVVHEYITLCNIEGVEPLNSLTDDFLEFTALHSNTIENIRRNVNSLNRMGLTVLISKFLEEEFNSVDDNKKWMVLSKLGQIQSSHWSPGDMAEIMNKLLEFTDIYEWDYGITRNVYWGLSHRADSILGAPKSDNRHEWEIESDNKKRLFAEEIKSAWLKLDETTIGERILRLCQSIVLLGYYHEFKWCTGEWMNNVKDHEPHLFWRDVYEAIETDSVGPVSVYFHVVPRLFPARTKIFNEDAWFHFRMEELRGNFGIHFAHPIYTEWD